MGKREKKGEGEGKGKGKWACRDNIQTAFTPTCQNVIKIALKYHADITPWQQNKCGATYFRVKPITLCWDGKKPVRIGRKEIVTITVISVDFVLMYNTGILVETLALKRCSSHRKSLAELCSFSQLRTIVTPNVYAVGVQVKEGHCMTISILSSLSWKKKNSTILIKQLKSTSRGQQQQSPHAQHLKMKRRFYKQNSLD